MSLSSRQRQTSFGTIGTIGSENGVKTLSRVYREGNTESRFQPFQPFQIADLMMFCTDQDIRLSVESDRLRVNGPPGGIDPVLRAVLVERKAEIIAYLGPPQDSTHNAPPIATTTETRPDYPRDLLAYTRRIGVKIWVEGGRLRWFDPNGESDPCEGLDDALRENQAALVAILEREQAGASSNRERAGSFFATESTTTLRSL